MAYKITDECIGCGSCAATCPMEAITEDVDVFKINPDICIDCGACVDHCPVDAIVEG